MMKQLTLSLLIVTFCAQNDVLACDHASTDHNKKKTTMSEKPARSPEGTRKLKQIHANLKKAFKKDNLQKRYLAAGKLKKLAKDEIDSDLLSHAIESMNNANPNYQWFIGHFLQNFSGKKNGINVQSWRTWLEDEYIPVVRKTAKTKKSQMKVIGKELSKGSHTMDHPNSVKAYTVTDHEGIDGNPNRTSPAKKDKKKDNKAKGNKIDVGVDVDKRTDAEKEIGQSDGKGQVVTKNDVEPKDNKENQDPKNSQDSSHGGNSSVTEESTRDEAKKNPDKPQPIPDGMQ